MTKSRLQTMRRERLAKMHQLQELGINPYPSHSHRDYTNRYAIDNFTKLQNKIISLTGRIVALRHHGKLAFIDIEDDSAKLQLYIKSTALKPLNIKSQILGFKELRLLNIGDFIEATGLMVKTNSGQISLMPLEIKILTKSLRPLPTRHDLANDPDFIFRRRYVDLATHPDQRELFRRKAAFWQANREFLQSKGFMEVEVPVLEQITGGADARPFTTYMNALNQNFFLRISTELYQKRLIGGGFEKIYTFGPNFRNEGISEEHLPEYYQVEWYWAYADYNDNMRLVEEMFKYIADQVYGRFTFTTRGHTFDLNQDWETISYPDIIRDRYDVDIFKAPDKEILKIIRQKGVELDGDINRNRLIDNLWKLIRKDIAGPAFLINEPAFMSPLSKSRADEPALTERFHVIIAGSELGNGYSELNNPLEQLDRFKNQQFQRDQGDDEAQMMDIDYVEMLEYGMPPTSGYGHSERIFWFLEDITARQGTFFPALKHKISPTTRRIYASLPAQAKKGH